MKTNQANLLDLIPPFYTVKKEPVKVLGKLLFLDKYTGQRCHEEEIRPQTAKAMAVKVNQIFKDGLKHFAKNYHVLFCQEREGRNGTFIDRQTVVYDRERCLARDCERFFKG